MVILFGRGIVMQINFDEIKQNSIRLVEHLPSRYEVAFAASLLEESRQQVESDFLWSQLDCISAFKTHSAKEYLDYTHNTDDFYMYYVKNKAATVSAIFGWDSDICKTLAIEVLSSIKINESVKKRLIRVVTRQSLPTISAVNRI